MDIQGYWYDGQNSGQQAAVARIDDRGYITVLPANSVKTAQKILTVQLADITISSRLGNTSRYLYFPDGQKFETRENDQVDQIVRLYKPAKQNSLLYRLETHWRYVLVAVVLMVGVIAWTAIYGVPLTAKAIATVMPTSLTDKAGQQTMAFLDKEMMQPTELDEAVQQRVRQHFATIIAEHPEQNITLHFRDSIVGANAFALPDGTIIFTDDMIELSEHDDELLSVMAHEVGHVVHRHGMRGVIQGSLVGFILMMMTGDASAATELFLGLPVLLTQLGYSREFEREADDYALEYMLERNLDPGHFARLMSRLVDNDCDAVADAKDNKGNDSEGTQGKSNQCDHGDDHGHNWQRYLSTHPDTRERIEKFTLPD